MAIGGAAARAARGLQHILKRPSAVNPAKRAGDSAWPRTRLPLAALHLWRLWPRPLRSLGRPEWLVGASSGESDGHLQCAPWIAPGLDWPGHGTSPVAATCKIAITMATPARQSRPRRAAAVASAECVSDLTWRGWRGWRWP